MIVVGYYVFVHLPVSAWFPLSYPNSFWSILFRFCVNMYIRWVVWDCSWANFVHFWLLSACHTSIFSFPVNNLSKYQSTFTKLGMCSILWRSGFGLLTGKFLQFLTELSAPPHMTVFSFPHDNLNKYWFFTKFGIIIIIGFLINVQVQGQHPHQCAPFQIAGLLHAWQSSHQRYVCHEVDSRELPLSAVPLCQLVCALVLCRPGFELLIGKFYKFFTQLVVGYYIFMFLVFCLRCYTKMSSSNTLCW